MNHERRSTLAANLTRLRLGLCAYMSPRFCDCKYGARGRGEETGCPELRSVVVLLERMTDEEHAAILSRPAPTTTGDRRHE